MSSKKSNSNHVQPFIRLQGELAKLIEETPPGQKLVSEPALAQQFGVSRATLREAMRSFEGQGLIRRRQGVGTFVISNPRIIETGLEDLESIEAQASRIGLAVSMGALQISQISASSEETTALEVEPLTPLIKVSRVIQTTQRPVAYLIDFLPEDILTPEDLEEGFTGSVLDLLLRRGVPELIKSDTEIRSVAASSEIARALEIQRGDVLQLFVARLFAVENKVVDYSLSYFIPGYFSFRVVRRVAK